MGLCLLLLAGAFVPVAASIVDAVVGLTWSPLVCSCRRWCSAGGCRGLLPLLSLFVLSASGSVVCCDRYCCWCCCCCCCCCCRRCCCCCCCCCCYCCCCCCR